MTTISATELQHMLSQTTPHMSGDDTLPVINSVHLEARDGYLFATATDRYTFAVARRPITTADQWTDVFIPAEHLRAVEAWLESTVGNITLAISRGSNEVAISLTSKTGSMQIAYDTSQYRYFPNWRNVLRGQLDAKLQPVPLTGFTTKYLARWEKAASVLQCWQYGPKGALVLVGEMGDFIGMQMPVFHEITRDDLLAKWRGSLARIAHVNGQAYSLETKWADAQGDPWEYTGHDRHGEPLMRVVGIEDDDHKLSDLVALYGPLTPMAANGTESEATS